MDDNSIPTKTKNPVADDDRREDIKKKAVIIKGRIKEKVKKKDLMDMCGWVSVYKEKVKKGGGV